jgi:ribosome-associated heat shock protein Hsp15
MNDLKTRIDKYLWAIRIFKTRSLASQACINGKIKLAGELVKPSKMVNVGDVYEIKTKEKNWIVEVVSIIQQRVPFSEAVKNYIDKTPIEINIDQKKIESSFIFNTGKRQSKQARPTKKQRRNLDDFMDT